MQRSTAGIRAVSDARIARAAAPTLRSKLTRATDDGPLTANDTPGERSTVCGRPGSKGECGGAPYPCAGA